MTISNYKGRAIITDIASYKKNFGFIKGMIASLVLKQITTGYIEFVVVQNSHQRKEIATTILKESIKQSSYKDYVLDVTNINTAAIRCYSAIGFEKFKRKAQ